MEFESTLHAADILKKVSLPAGVTDEIFVQFRNDPMRYKISLKPEKEKHCQFLTGLLQHGFVDFQNCEIKQLAPFGLGFDTKDAQQLLDELKNIGFQAATKAGLSFGKDDMLVPPTKETIIAETQKEVEKIHQANSRGIITEGERYLKVIDAWTHARERIGEDMLNELRNETRNGKHHVNPIYCMIMSKARGSVEQIRQLAGMRGLMAKPSGKIIETPIRANFREGLRVLEYFSSTHGARKGLADTALKTADSGSSRDRRPRARWDRCHGGCH